MTIIDPRARASWPMHEPNDSLHPSDAVGNLDDLVVPAGIVRPAAVHGTPTGYGRDFVRSTLTGFIVNDAGGKLLLTRGLAVVALLRLDVEQLANGNLCVILQRGRGGGGDPISFGVRLEVVTASTRTCKVVMYWQTVAGADVVDAGMTFTWPAGRFLIVSAVREVIEGQLAVRYQVNELAGEGEQDHALDCGGVAAADVSMGMGMAGAAYNNHLDGTIDALEVLGEAVSPDELEFVWKRHAVCLPAGIETMRRMVPRGVYSRDPGSNVQRELAVEGQALGHAKSLALRLREYFLPDRAWGEYLEFWERMLAVQPQPSDHIQKRRDRVLALLGTQRGYTLADVRTQLAEPFGLDEVDVGILEYDNDYVQPFAAHPGDAIEIQGNGNAWAVAGGVLKASQTGNVDLRYDGSGRSMMWLRSLSSGDDAWVGCKIAVVGDDVNGDAVGAVVLGRRLTNEWVWIGLRKPSAGVSDVVWFKYQQGVLDTAVTVIGSGTGSDPLFLWLHLLPDGTIDVRWGSSDAAAKAAAPVNIAPGIGVAEYAGCSVAAPGGHASGNGEIDFDDLYNHCPNGHERFNWYAYRDPLLPGAANLDLARLVVARIKPAHTTGSACTTLSLKCGDPDNGCGQAPLGK